MTISLHDKLVAASPPVISLPYAHAIEVVDDLQRILSLPRRSPLDCRFDPVLCRYLSPKTEALIKVMTAKFGRGKRLSCACRPRVVRALGHDHVQIIRVVPEEAPPEPPLITTKAAFAADAKLNAEEIANVERVLRLKPNEEVRLLAGDHEEDEAGHVCIDTLNAIQAWAAYEVPREAGGLFHLGIGSGKSICYLLLAMILKDECELAALLIEPNQRMHYVSQYRQLREHFRVPSIIFDDGHRPYLSPGEPTLHLIPYTKLGNPKHPDELEALNPNVLGADEAHRLTGPTNSTTRIRVRRFIEKKIKEREHRMGHGLPVKRRAVFFVPGSGTLEDKSVEDTQPVAAHALGTGSPLPIDKTEAGRWSPVFDPVRVNDRKSHTARRLQEAFTGHVWAGADAGGSDFVSMLLDDGPEKAIREGFNKWRRETPGVLTAQAAEIGASLYFKMRKPPKMPDCVQAALQKVREKGELPDGEVILGDDKNNVDAAIKIVSKQIGSGFHYYWAWPKIPDTPEGNLQIDEWFARRKRYGREARSMLLRGIIHLDSPKLLANAAERAMADASPPAGMEIYCTTCRAAKEWPCGIKSHLPAWRSNHYKLWSEIEDKVPHEQRVRWIGHDLPEAADPKTHPGYFLARDTVKYAESDPAVVWYQSVAFGHKVAQLAGLPCHDGGPNGEAELRADLRDNKGKKSVICSLRSWGKGFNGLQFHYFRQLFAELPSRNKIMEQALGRLLRKGQTSDAIHSHYYAHIVELREALRKIRRSAEFNQSMSSPALILSADFDD